MSANTISKTVLGLRANLKSLINKPAMTRSKDAEYSLLEEITYSTHLKLSKYQFIQFINFWACSARVLRIDNILSLKLQHSNRLEVKTLP
jgi:hypothetical protein